MYQEKESTVADRPADPIFKQPQIKDQYSLPRPVETTLQYRKRKIVEARFMIFIPLVVLSLLVASYLGFVCVVTSGKIPINQTTETLGMVLIIYLPYLFILAAALTLASLTCLVIGIVMLSKAYKLNETPA